MLLAKVEIHGNESDKITKELSGYIQTLLDYFADEVIERTKSEFGKDVVLTMKVETGQ